MCVPRCNADGPRRTVLNIARQSCWRQRVLTVARTGFRALDAVAVSRGLKIKCTYTHCQRIGHWSCGGCLEGCRCSNHLQNGCSVLGRCHDRVLREWISGGIHWHENERVSSDSSPGAVPAELQQIANFAPGQQAAARAIRLTAGCSEVTKDCRHGRESLQVLPLVCSHFTSSLSSVKTSRGSPGGTATA